MSEEVNQPCPSPHGARQLIAAASAGRPRASTNTRRSMIEFLSGLNESEERREQVPDRFITDLE